MVERHGDADARELAARAWTPAELFQDVADARLRCRHDGDGRRCCREQDREADPQVASIPSTVARMRSGSVSTL